MPLGTPTSLPPTTDVAAALTTARDHLGQRPAVTVLRADRREEQGVASLAQWAAKGAHAIEAELLLEPGDALHLDAPLSWTTAAVCLAAWWAGVVVRLDGSAEVAVVHASRTPPDDAHDVLWLGDAVDGSAEAAGESWVHVVQSFPDQPPRPRAGADQPALHRGDHVLTQAELVSLAADQGAGTLGIDAATADPVAGLIAVAVRPLVVGRPTVILDGTSRDAAAGERVGSWW